MTTEDHSKTDFEERLKARIDRHRTEYADAHERIFGHRPDRVEPPPDLSRLPPEEALTAYEAWARRRTFVGWEEFLRARQAERPEPQLGPALLDELAGQPGRQLALVDRLVHHAFDLDRRLPDLRPAHPIRYCTSLEEFARPLEQHLHWPADQRDSAIRRVLAGARDVPLIAEPAYDLHGVGTFVNGWLLAGSKQGANPYNVLDGDRTFLAKVLGQIAAVRWGRGFLRTYSALGQEICQAGLAHAPLQKALGQQLDEQAHAVQRAFFLSRAGWSEWVGAFIEAQAQQLLLGRRQERSNWHMLSELGGLAWEHVVPSIPGMDLVQGILNFFLQSAKTLGLTLRFWGESAAWISRHSDEARSTPKPAAHQQFRNWFGRMLIQDLERRVGTYNLPYALLIAENVRYGLPEVIMPDLIASMQDMRQNPDGRLVLLTMLEPSAAYDPQELAILAEHELQLAAPEVIRRPPGVGC